MDSEVQTNSTRTSKNAKKLYYNIENRNQKIKHKVGGTNEGEELPSEVEALPKVDTKEKERQKVSDAFKTMNERLKRHRIALDRVDGIIVKMGNALTDTKQEVSTVDDSNNDTIALMKKQIQSMEKKFDDIKQKEEVVQDSEQVLNLKTELEKTNIKVAEIEKRNSEIEALQEAMLNIHVRKKEESKKKRRSQQWVDTPKIEDYVKQGNAKSTKSPVEKPEILSEEESPAKEQQDDEEVQEELGTLDDIPPKVTT